MAKSNIDISNVYLKDCYFAEIISDDFEDPTFGITPKVYFDEFGCLHDCFSEIKDLPKHWGNSMEAIWEFYGGSSQMAIESLEAQGAVYSQEMHDYLKD
jgi:hypothetical protein